MVYLPEEKIDDILSDRFIHDLLRDQRAMRRALRQSDAPECLAPTTKAAKSNMAPVFRRGCNENVSTLRFLNCLRGCGDVINSRERETALKQRVKDLWNPSTRVSGCCPNLLQHLLLRHLQRHGFLQSYETSRAVVIEKQESRLAMQNKKREEQKASRMAEEKRKQQQRLFIQETEQRAEIQRAEHRRRQNYIDGIHDRALVFLQDIEFHQRQAIFQSFHDAYLIMQRKSKDELQRITGLNTPLRQTYSAILQKEKQQRDRILMTFDRERSAIAANYQQIIQKQIQQEIVQVSNKQEMLQKMIQILAKQKSGSTRQ